MHQGSRSIPQESRTHAHAFRFLSRHQEKTIKRGKGARSDGLTRPPSPQTIPERTQPLVEFALTQVRRAQLSINADKQVSQIRNGRRAPIGVRAHTHPAARPVVRLKTRLPSLHATRAVSEEKMALRAIKAMADMPVSTPKITNTAATTQGYPGANQAVRPL